MRSMNGKRWCLAALMSATVGISPVTQAGGSDGRNQAATPLKIILTVSLDVAINGKNAICSSDVMTLPGPPGWRVGSPAFIDSAYRSWEKANETALSTIQSYKDTFLAKCREYGAAKDGNFGYLYNRDPDQVQNMEKFQQRQRDDGMPIVKMP